MSRQREQLYVFISRLNDKAPPLRSTPDEIADQHHAYLQDLFDRKVLVGSGAAKDETGRRYAGGVVILRAKSVADAEEIARKEPYCVAAQRIVEIIPWQRTWFEQ